MGFTWHKIIITINSHDIRWVLSEYRNISYLSSIGRISTGAQYVAPDSNIYCEKVKMSRFGTGSWFFCPKFVQLAMAGNGRNKAVHLQ
jgi:hypothetical protein